MVCGSAQLGRPREVTDGLGDRPPRALGRYWGGETARGNARPIRNVPMQGRSCRPRVAVCTGSHKALLQRQACHPSAAHASADVLCKD